MSQINKLYRNFIILQEDERGHSTTSDKTLSGYSKIEAKGEKCKVSFYAQNLRKDNYDYNIMLICNKRDSKQLIDLGKMPISESGKGECTKEYFVDNIAGLDIEFDKISGAAIVKMKDGTPVFIMCGFMNGEQPSENWKNYKVVKAVEGSNKPKMEMPKKESEKKSDKKKDYKDNKKNKPQECEKCKDNKKDCENSSSHGEKVDPRGKFEEYEDSIQSNSNDTFEVRGSVGEYFEGIARGFENCKDKYDEIKYCKWYRVDVNDLYEMCNMSNYNKYTVAYYPMLNYYPYIKKHGKFMLGYKCDRSGELKYIVYGVPGKKDKDDQPYEGKTGFVTWVSDDDSNRDGMGCWLMFYDFKNSTVVVPMQ